MELSWEREAESSSWRHCSMRRKGEQTSTLRWLVSGCQEARRDFSGMISREIRLPGQCLWQPKNSRPLIIFRPPLIPPLIWIGPRPLRSKRSLEKERKKFLSAVSNRCSGNSTAQEGSELVDWHWLFIMGSFPQRLEHRASIP